MAQYLAKYFREFKDDERGSFSLFMIIIFTTMVLIGGAAIDLARYDTVRSTFQSNLDRSVLAAASMRQTQSPAAVVQDYMNKVDALSSYNVSMDAKNTSVSLTGRHVSATATAVLGTYFLKIAGIDTINVVAASQASEEIPNLEISLVLDVSGSMSGSKITSMKLAANQFIDEVINPDGSSLTAISVVPYSTNVSVPQSMWDLYKTEGLTTKSRCMIFPDADFSKAGIDINVTQRQLPYYSFPGGFQSGLDFSNCKTDTYAEIMPFETSAETLQYKINSLQASGNTATHIGAKWGAALLDPMARPITANMGGKVVGLPADYGQAGVKKIMVVMTDGQNTNHYDLFDHYRSGGSDMYYVSEITKVCGSGDTDHDSGDDSGSDDKSHDDGKDKSHDDGKDKSHDDNKDKSHGDNKDKSHDDGKDKSHDDGDSDDDGDKDKCHGDDETVTIDNSGYYIYNPDDGKYYKVDAGYSLGTQFDTLPGDPSAAEGSNGYQRRLPWGEVWEIISVSGYAKTIGIQSSSIEKKYATADQADANMLASCSAAKNKGVVVYSIAFSAPTHAQDLLKNCATSLSTYYDAKTSDIATVFASIAMSIQKLKLTQ